MCEFYQGLIFVIAMFVGIAASEWSHNRNIKLADKLENSKKIDSKSRIEK
jgi:hypothetical protein